MNINFDLFGFDGMRAGRMVRLMPADTAMTRYVEVGISAGTMRAAFVLIMAAVMAVTEMAGLVLVGILNRTVTVRMVDKTDRFFVGGR